MGVSINVYACNMRMDFASVLLGAYIIKFLLSYIFGGFFVFFWKYCNKV